MIMEVPRALLSRAESEFLEMPGLKLTPSQAGRLWGLEPTISELVLAALAASGFLFRSQDGAYLLRSGR